MNKKIVLVFFFIISASGALIAWLYHRAVQQQSVGNYFSNATIMPLFLPWRVDIGDNERLATAELSQSWFEYMVGEEGGEFGYQVTRRRNMVTGEEVEVSRTDGKGETVSVENESSKDPLVLTAEAIKDILPYQIEYGLLEQAAVSPAGDKVAFTYRNNGSDSTNVLAVINRDGAGFKILREGAVRTTPFFSPDGEAVLYIVKVEGDSVLSYYHLTTDRYARMVTLPGDYDEWIPSWTDEELLAMVGIDTISEDTATDIIPHKGRLLLLDLKRDILIYASPVLIGETGFIGFGGFHGFGESEG